MTRKMIDFISEMTQARRHFQNTKKQNKTTPNQNYIASEIFFQKQRSGINQLSDKQKQRVYDLKIHITKKCVTERPQAK